ncbi:MAG: hypothetical protein ACLP7P_02285 [Rhodomicrobium sp.]
MAIHRFVGERDSSMIASPKKTRGVMQADEFENRLRQDLPRGHVAQAKPTGRERGLSARTNPSLLLGVDTP